MNQPTGVRPGVVVKFENNSDDWLNFELSDFERLGRVVHNRMVLISGLCGARRLSSGLFDGIALCLDMCAVET
jgi:hypothetical protein